MYWNAIMTIFNVIISKININMRCIEITHNNQVLLMLVRLTLTWDVLKFCTVDRFLLNLMWLTLTWDVLKLFLF